MYAWAKNAPTTSLPDGVGFRIGGQTGIRFLTLQIHYAKALPEGVEDHSGVQMKLTQQKYARRMCHYSYTLCIFCISWICDGNDGNY